MHLVVVICCVLDCLGIERYCLLVNMLLERLVPQFLQPLRVHIPGEGRRETYLEVLGVG